ncbi:cytochrome c oxidase assembly factor 4 homolog, mitochondrial [Thamnophis elegans]|uniref:cytochrome c oxidase assembly factor 4 homolog, mitochondrial n=1 Tax=Thamnophis elegans TaxID=35005 RepID=UPI001378EB06|nr:cytochrome c oxidase assembly factor 4 homolog, mitochondrial [Thamnophis elegans]XP_032076189.1 cytochrome c oxidase assembly factor 4 homolog, mitochondrial [Thamnophis elegans]XP_032076190.1 cytochrome c oxidase assembly factor 4 homolog, mitochondrial [Thamnophis elegans]XP_032076191.1 cytochrome c oxidase assembly factor 4 homolog, mitochondrial [Thamnophis elegans]XP_032076192.1 cytochrome c oxidase assembly factor 4 homolog, mitochondrial [Thamnophis elegans]XP_032076193.1 cytochrome
MSGHNWSQKTQTRKEEEEEEEEDPFDQMIQRTGCATFHYAVMECMAEHQDWRKCQEQVQSFRTCMAEHQKQQAEEVRRRQKLHQAAS